MPGVDLVNFLVGNSSTDNVARALREWHVAGCSEDPDSEEECLCGHQGLRYLYMLENEVTGVLAFPVGSTCVRGFASDELNSEVNGVHKLAQTRAALLRRERIMMDSIYFSRASLAYLLEHGAFEANVYNRHDPERDYAFLLGVFNRSGWCEPRYARKLTALIMQIKTFLLDPDGPITAAATGMRAGAH